MMKIGFDVAQTCQERAGCAWYADSLARAMIDVAPEHEYTLYHQFGKLINEDTSTGTYIEHPAVSMPLWQTSADVARQVWTRVTAGEAPPGNPEIVQSNSFQVVEPVGAKLVFVVYDVSFWVCPEFTTEVNRLYCQQGVLDALRRADGFIFISESAKQEFETVLPGWLKRKHKPAIVTPLASRLDPRNGQKPEERFWLAVGSMEPRKNYAALFSAMEKYWSRSTNPVPLHIVAPTGWKNDELKARASQLESAGRVRMLRQVHEEALSDLYQQALALVFPSWYEGFGLPVLEAMQCGCPVICSNRTSLAEIGGDAVRYIDPANPDSVCDAMLAFEQDTAVRNRHREAGLERATHFSWRRTALATLEFYQEVLNDNRVKLL
jgi:glycosyltransferase involved in cell wall biosynthesis